MYKQIDFPAHGENGERLVHTITPGAGLTKLASDAYHTTQRFIDKLKPKKGKLYLLVNALGAGEFYGANRNGDYFEEEELNPSQFRSLSVSEADYDPFPSPPPVGLSGYHTFHWAGMYRAHQNKDKTRSYGKVVFSTYNEDMHRVELILEIDRARAKELGHQDLIEQIDAGIAVAVSMGCRVKYDVCNICGNKAKTRADYCTHAARMMGQILPSGKQVCVRNPQPVFHDLSIVLVGADRVSFGMSKVAHLLGQKRGHFGKSAASLKEAATRKHAEINKAIPAASAEVIPRLGEREPALSLPELTRIHRAISPSVGLGSLLTGALASGVLFSPPEFQALALLRGGRGDLAERLHAQRRVFGGSCHRRLGGPLQLGGMGSVGPMHSALSGHLPGRSAHMPFLSRRATPFSRTIVLIKHAAADFGVDGSTALSQELSALYNEYRVQSLEKFASLMKAVRTRSPELYVSVTAGEDGVDSLLGLSKHGGLDGVDPETIAYLYGAHGTAGDSPVGEMLSTNSVLSASVLLGLARLGAGVLANGSLGRALHRLPL